MIRVSGNSDLWAFQVSLLLQTGRLHSLTLVTSGENLCEEIHASQRPCGRNSVWLPV